MFQIPNSGSVYLYQKPINMRWGEKKLTQLCRDEMGIDPRAGEVFLFYNSKRDQLKLPSLDQTGSQEFQEWVPRGAFLLPAPRDGEKFVKVDHKKLNSIFRS